MPGGLTSPAGFIIEPVKSIRIATGADAPAIARIYAPFCASTTVSFEYTAPSTEEMADRIATVTKQYPWLVLIDDGVVAGYAYASRHRERAAYAWSVDTAVYVDPGHHRQGVARALYARLFELLRRQGYVNAYAGVALPNPASVGLHESVGFVHVGVYQRVGYKHGAWHDVAWLHAELQPPPDHPEPPRPISEFVTPGSVLF